MNISQCTPNTSRAREEAGHPLTATDPPALQGGCPLPRGRGSYYRSSMGSHAFVSPYGPATSHPGCAPKQPSGTPLGRWGSVDRPPKLCHRYKCFPTRGLGRKIALEGEEGWGSVTFCDATQAPPCHEPSQSWRIIDSSADVFASGCQLRTYAIGERRRNFQRSTPNVQHSSPEGESAAPPAGSLRTSTLNVERWMLNVEIPRRLNCRPINTPLSPGYRPVFRRARSRGSAAAVQEGCGNGAGAKPSPRPRLVPRGQVVIVSVLL